MTHVHLPLLTSSLPGIGGSLRLSPEDFRVEELPAYTPAGSGDHVLCRIQKRGLTTFEAVRRLAEALGVNERDVGTAGLKDRHAVTTQWISLPPPVTPESVLAVRIPDLVVLEAARHGNKLRTGHLRGNRFAIRVVRPSVPLDEAAARATAILTELSAAPGAPNWYGEQRFGRGGDTSEGGRRLIASGGRGGPRGRAKRLAISAFQSRLFNEVLRARIEDGLYREVLGGDLCQLHGHARHFAAADPIAETVRLRAGEITVTGPMFGHSVALPSDGSPALERELSILRAHELSLDAFAPLGKLAPGTRRPLAVPIADPRVEVEDDAVLLGFTLPAGAYATTVLAEITKTEVRE